MPEWAIALISAGIGSLASYIALFFERRNRTLSHGEELYKRRLDALEDFAEVALEMRLEYESLMNDIQEGWTIEQVPEELIEERFEHLDKSVVRIRAIEPRIRSYFHKETLVSYDGFALIHGGFQLELRSVIYGEEPSHDLKLTQSRFNDLIFKVIDDFRMGAGIEAINAELHSMLPPQPGLSRLKSRFSSLWSKLPWQAEPSGKLPRHESETPAT